MTDSDKQMTLEELAAQLGTEVHVPKELEFPEEDIYAVSARIKNMAVETTENNLTPVGIQLANAYTHVILDMYKFANTLPAADCARLKTLVRSQEEFVGKFVAVIPPPQGVQRTIAHTLDPKGELIYIDDNSRKLVELYMKSLELPKDLSKSMLIRPGNIKNLNSPLPPSSNKYEPPKSKTLWEKFIYLFF